MPFALHLSRALSSLPVSTFLICSRAYCLSCAHFDAMRADMDSASFWHSAEQYAFGFVPFDFDTNSRPQYLHFAIILHLLPFIYTLLTNFKNVS
jgi:hypothetical protein